MEASPDAVPAATAALLSAVCSENEQLSMLVLKTMDHNMEPMTMNGKTIQQQSPSPSPGRCCHHRQKTGCLSVQLADAIMDWFIFPALLFVQFGTTMYTQVQRNMDDVHDASLPIGWIQTMATVTLFCLVAIAYRTIYRIHPIQSLWLLLLPEVFTNTVLATVMFAPLSTAYEVLVVLTAVMMILVWVGYVQVVQHRRQVVPAANVDDDDGYQPSKKSVDRESTNTLQVPYVRLDRYGDDDAEDVEKNDDEGEWLC